QVPDVGWLRERVCAAWDLRAPLREAGCTAYRWLFGEGDGLPGLTVDRYGDFAVVQTYMEGAGQLVEWLVEALNQVAPVRGVLLNHRDAEDGERLNVKRSNVQTLRGHAPPTNLVVREHGIQFFADLRAGQKTGLFLDHRENRRFVEGLSAGRTVLNCFAYTGAFSLYALRGGAQSGVTADSGMGPAQASGANIAL